MSTFGLVHGGGFGPWCWARLIPELRARGHHAAIVDLAPDDQVAGAARCADVPEMFTAPAPFWEDEAVATHFLLQDCPPEMAHDAFRRLRPEPGVLGREMTPLVTWPDVPCAYVVCTDDRTATPAWARRAARERLGVEPIELPGGHCPFLARPEQLAEALDRCS